MQHKIALETIYNECCAKMRMKGEMEWCEMVWGLSLKLQRTISHCTYSSVNRSSKNLKRNERKIIQHFSGRQSRTACRNEINSASRDEFNKVAAAAATGHHIACLPSPPLPFLLPLAALSGHPLTSGLWSVWLRLWLPDFPVEWCHTAHTIPHVHNSTHSIRSQYTLHKQHTCTHSTHTMYVHTTLRDVLYWTRLSYIN